MEWVEVEQDGAPQPAGSALSTLWGYLGTGVEAVRSLPSAGAGLLWAGASRAAEATLQIASSQTAVLTEACSNSADRALTAAKREGKRMLLPSSLEARTPSHWRSVTDVKRFEAVPETCSRAAFEEMLEPAGTLGGRDLRYRHPIGYQQLKVAAVWRIENASLWLKYDAERENLRRSLKSALSAGANVPTVDVRPAFKLAAGQLPGELDGALNEQRLAHATTPQSILPIISQGFNGGLAGAGAFGMGTYFAEDVGKCDQYATPDWDYKDSEEMYGLHDLLYPDGQAWHPEDVFYVFICRVLLGVFASTRDGSNHLAGGSVWREAAASGVDKTRQRELGAIPETLPAEPFHALVVETGGILKRYREFISFHADSRAYPEYLIAYKRVPARLPHED